MTVLHSSVDIARRCFNKGRRMLVGDAAENHRRITQRYLDFTGKLPNLKNPQGFLEKLAWLSLYHRDPRIPTLVDKWLARDAVARLVGPEVLNDLLGVWDQPQEIPFDQLPDQFVLKATGGSGWNIICRDKSKLDIEQSIAKLRHWQKQNYYFRYREWQYKSLRSRIIAERFMSDPDHPERCAADFKLFCFDGTPRVLGISSDRWGDTRHDFFDPDWNSVDYGVGMCPRSNPPLQKPHDLDRILDIASRLSRGFPFVRVDLYRFDSRVIFGEMTFSPSAGIMPIQQPEADATWGQWLKLPTDKRRKEPRTKRYSAQ